MADDINIRVRADGAKQAQQDLQNLARAEGQVGRSGKSAGKDVSEGFGKTSGAINRALSSIKSFFGAFLGIQGVLRALASMRQELEAIEAASLNSAKAMRGVMALSTLGRARPEVQKDVQAFQRAAGRENIGEVANAYYAFLGGTAGMDPKRQQGLLQQIALFAQTDKTANLEQVAGLFSTIGTQQPTLGPQQIGNLVSHTIEQAKSTPTEMAQYLPDVLTAGKAGRVDAGALAAMFSFATRRGGGVAKSGQSVKSALLGLLAPPDETAKELRGYGFDPNADLMSKVQWLAKSGNQLPPELIAALGGRRGLQSVSEISLDPAAFNAEVAASRGALGAPGSRLEGRLKSMYAEAPAQRYLQALEQVQIRTQQHRARPGALKNQAMREMYLQALREQGMPAFAVDLAEWQSKAYQYLGGHPLEGMPTVMRERFENAADTGRPTFVGGTHYHGAMTDPAGKPRVEVPD